MILEKEIRSERWQNGERLPTERELCSRYGVARNTLRRALQSLEDNKLIVRHVGRGTFKSSAAAQEVSGVLDLDRIEEFSPADVMECRLIFEPGLVPHVVARATKADLDRMTECLKRGGAATSLAEFEHWDTELHDAIAAATQASALGSAESVDHDTGANEKSAGRTCGDRGGAARSRSVASPGPATQASAQRAGLYVRRIVS